MTRWAAEREGGGQKRACFPFEHWTPQNRDSCRETRVHSSRCRLVQWAGCTPRSSEAESLCFSQRAPDRPFLARQAPCPA